MTQAQRATKMNPGQSVKTESGRESVEITEAIKALQAQLADLRKIVQAARSSADDDLKPGQRQ